MADTATRPLPVDMATLRAHYLPPAPDGTDVARYRRAIARLDALVADAVAQLDQVTRREHDETDQLVEQAADPGPITVTGLVPGDERRHVEHRVARLRTARALAARRHTTAERQDPRHVAWVAECKRIVAEWNDIQSLEPEQRFTALAGLAAARQQPTTEET